MKDKIIIVYSSHLSEHENFEFEKHVSDTIGVPHEIKCYVNHNQYSLSHIYNRAIKELHDDKSIMVFCHNDIVFKTEKWGKGLLGKFNNLDYQIIGVAGSTYLPESGRWWEKPETMVGIVEHTNGLRNWVSYYSKKQYIGVKDVCLIDGLFMAVNTTELSEFFDEDFNGFHFYDLSFCLPNWLDGLNIGVVTDIRILHKSIGMTNQQWENNRQLFVNKYNGDLPVKI